VISQLSLKEFLIRQMVRSRPNEELPETRDTSAH
jgi:hypothetical protein